MLVPGPRVQTGGLSRVADGTGMTGVSALPVHGSTCAEASVSGGVCASLVSSEAVGSW